MCLLACPSAPSIDALNPLVGWLVYPILDTFKMHSSRNFDSVRCWPRIHPKKLLPRMHFIILICITFSVCPYSSPSPLPSLLARRGKKLRIQIGTGWFTEWLSEARQTSSIAAVVSSSYCQQRDSDDDDRFIMEMHLRCYWLPVDCRQLLECAWDECTFQHWHFDYADNPKFTGVQNQRSRSNAWAEDHVCKSAVLYSLYLPLSHC